MADLPGIKPAAWCPAYHKTSDRQVCGDRRCKFYVDHIITISSQTHTETSPDVDEELNALSIEVAVIRAPRVHYVIGAKCDWHCCRYDEPSKLETLPWE